MRILLVEDDWDLGAAVARYLRGQNCVVDLANNGEDGRHLGSTERYDVAVLDLGLPKVDGLSVLRYWRDEKQKMPVLILTARDVWTDKIRGGPHFPDSFAALLSLPVDHAAVLRPGPSWTSTGVLPPSAE